MKCVQNNNKWLYFVGKPGELKAKMREKKQDVFLASSAMDGASKALAFLPSARPCVFSKYEPCS